MRTGRHAVFVSIALLAGASAMIGCSSRAAVSDGSTTHDDLVSIEQGTPRPDGAPVGDVPTTLPEAGRDAALDGSDPDAQPVEAGPRPDIGGTKCSDPTPCGGFACNTTLGICRTACYSDNHCASGYQCGANHTCVKQTSCTDVDTPCLPYSCDRATGQCNTTCVTSASCAAGKACDARSGTCVNEIKCTDDTPCKGYACDTNAGQCRLLCLFASHCASGYSCGGGGVCVKDTSCSNDTPCAPYTCNTQQGQCNTACNPFGGGGGGGCVSGYTCGGQLKCYKDIACTTDAPCGAYICDTSTNKCRAGCAPFIAQWCAAGYICSVAQGGVCVHQ